MSKSDRPIEQIDCSRASESLGEPDYGSDKPINAFDFETAEGEPVMLAYDWSDGDSGVVTSVDGDGPRMLSPSALWSYLTDYKARNSLNVWYNLNFDAQVLLKGLSREQIREINRTNRTTVTAESGVEWEVTYLPKKVLKFRSENRDTIAHYDISQFSNPYGGSLDTDAQEWLDRGKLSDVDIGEIAENSHIDGDGYVRGDYRDNWSQIKDYAERDVEITRELATEIIRVAEQELEPSVPMGKPYSTGYVAADWIRSHYEYKPGFSRKAVQSLAWDAYAGGRFEVFERGNTGAVAGPDINSAYPYVMAELPDPATLEWYPTTDYAEVEQAVDDPDGMAFVRATVTTDAERRIQPFAVKNPQAKRVEYPAVDGATITTIGPIFAFAERNGYLEDYEIEKAYVGMPTDDREVSYPFSDLPDIYDKRKRLEADGQTKKGLLLKIVMNSLYGKTCQTTLRYTQLDDYVESHDGVELEDFSGVVTNPDMYEDQSDRFGMGPLDPWERLKQIGRGDAKDWYVESQVAGRLYNPIFASYITGMTRLELHKRVVEYGLESDTYMFATDCIMVDRDAFRSTSFVEDLQGDALGAWDFDYSGSDSYIIGSGIYEVWDGEDDPLKTKTRGFKEFSGGSLREQMADSDPDAPLPVESFRPVTVGDALHTNTPLSEVATFKSTTRGLRPDMDGKRAWSESVNWDDLLTENQYGPAKVWDGDSWEP